MSEEIIKNDGSDSNEISLFIIDETDTRFLIDVPKNATLEDVVKKIRGFNLRCFNSKDKKYFALIKGGKPITDSENIKKTIADLNIEGGDNIYVIARTEVTEKNKGKFLEIKKLETETKSEQTSTVPNKNIGEITVYVRDPKDEKVELKLKSDAAFEDLLIALKKANRTSVMKSAEYFKLFFYGKNLSDQLKSKDLQQVKINDLGIKDNYVLLFVVPINPSQDTAFSWANIKSMDEEDFTEFEGENKEQKSVNTNIDNLKAENQITSALDKVVNTEEMLKKENLILRIIRKVKSFFSWLYEILFGKRNSQEETAANSQISMKDEIQLRENKLVSNQEMENVPHISPNGTIEENHIDINKSRD